jgi:hypothetical protein
MRLMDLEKASNPSRVKEKIAIFFRGRCFFS